MVVCEGDGCTAQPRVSVIEAGATEPGACRWCFACCKAAPLSEGEKLCGVCEGDGCTAQPKVSVIEAGATKPGPCRWCAKCAKQAPLAEGDALHGDRHRHWLWLRHRLRILRMAR